MNADLDEREWLEPDGLGGFAMGTVSGAATRRYHGLLCVAATPPTGRVMLVNALSETVDDVALDTHIYPGAIFPDGHTRLRDFTSSPWPTWRYDVAGQVVTREIVVARGAPRTIIRWTGTRGILLVRPFVSGRDLHALHRENAALDPHCVVSDGCVELAPYGRAVVGVRLVHSGTFETRGDWYRSFVYPVERERGLDCEEDLFAPGVLRFDLAHGPAVLLLEPLSTAKLSLAQVDPALAGERTRRGALVKDRAEPLATLVRAADQFVVRASPGGAPRSTVIAGYPWFTDWGRDTFIVARGLGVAFGPALERELLSAWEPFLDRGMIPNRFPDNAPGQTCIAEYNAVDASLWFALRCARHLVATAATSLDPDPLAEKRVRDRLRDAVHRVFEGFLAGTRHGIHVDDDGLVHAAEAGLQLTWMDAKVDGWVVTPRAGKPVEVQALWIAVCEAAAKIFADDEPALASEMIERAAWARSSFAAHFWCEARGWMYDVLDGPTRDETLRPNQLYALGLVRPLVDADRARQALQAVERELVVPVGLRTRARGPGYCGRMEGDPRARDGAYHQGTVWPFLLGIYADACQRVRGRVPKPLLDGVLAHLRGPGLGQIAEVFDGDAPHPPRGCPAQAWSVAEALRVAAGAIAED